MIKKALTLSIFGIFALTAHIPTANAQCTNPGGTTGHIKYNTAEDLIQGCKADNNWQAFHSLPATPDITSDLLGHWTLDETSGTFADSSGNGNTGSVANNSGDGVYYSQTGAIGNAAGFPGVDEHIGVGDIALSGNTTFAAWVKSSDDTKSRMSIFFRNVVVVNRVPQMDVDNGILEFNHGDGVGNNTYSSGVYITDGQWRHVAFVAEYPKYYFYVDGVKVASGTMTADIQSFGTGLQIGGDNNFSDTVWTGEIDDARIYDRALAAVDIKALYDLGKVDITTGLVSHWELEDTDTTAIDSTGPNNGSMNGGLDGANDSVSGIVGNALQFDGTDDFIYTSASIDGLSELTVTAWARPSVWDGSRGIMGPGGSLLIANEVGGSNNWDFRITGDVTSNSCRNSMSGQEPGKWSFLAVTYDGNVCTYRLNNNIYIEPADEAGVTFSTPQNIQIGRGNNSYSDSWWQGQIDDVRFYDRALSPAKIDAIYAQGFDCMKPNGKIGGISYNSSSRVFQGCTDNGWIALHETAPIVSVNGYCSLGGMQNPQTVADYTAPFGYTVADGSERLLLVTVLLEGPATYDATAVSFDGNALTEAAEVTEGAGWSDNLSVWYLPVDNVMGAGGHTGNIDITYTGTPAAKMIAAGYVEYVDQLSPISETQTANLSGTAINVSYTLADNTMAFDAVGHQVNEAMTADNGQNKIAEVFSTAETATLTIGGRSFLNSDTPTLGWSKTDTGRTVMISAELDCSASAPQGICTSPEGNLGKIIYNTDHDVYQGCTPAGWIALHQ